MKSANRVTVVFLCFAASALLLFALIANPSPNVQEFLQLAVFGASLYVASALYDRNEKLFPLALALGSLGLLELLGKLDPHGQQMLHWATISALAVSGIAMLRGRRPRADVQALRGEVGALRSQLREALESNDPEHVLGTTVMPPKEYFRIVREAYTDEELSGELLLSPETLRNLPAPIRAEYEERVGRLLQRERLVLSLDSADDGIQGKISHQLF